MTSNVLVPMDRSPAARAALEFALEEFADDEITIIHITNPVEGSYFASEEDFYTHFERFEQESERRAEAIFEDAQDVADGYGVTLRTDTHIGQPARAIVEYVEENDIDHVVIGSHGRSGVARLVLGSVAENVVRRAPVPVTVIKVPKEE